LMPCVLASLRLCAFALKIRSRTGAPEARHSCRTAFNKITKPRLGRHGGRAQAPEDVAPDGAGKFLRRVSTKMARLRRSDNRNAVAAFSPVLPRSGYAGWGMQNEINSEGVEATPAMMMEPRWG